MLSTLPTSSTLDALVPITRFNKGEANKIFDEVVDSGCKIVVKNNLPACVLISPEKYKEIIEMIEDVYLIELATARLARESGITHSAEDVYEELGIVCDADDEIPMDLGIDFE